jgi:preprotein translocase subunit SecA
MRHIDDMSHLREEVAFEWYAQKNPLVVYQERAYDKFINLLSEMWFKVMKWLLTANPNQKIEQVEINEKELELLLQDSWINLPEDMAWLKNLISDSMYQNSHNSQQNEDWVKVYKVDTAAQKNTVEFPKVWRNDPCPCGSGKKYKQCHWK